MKKALLLMMAVMIAGPGYCEKAMGGRSDVTLRKVEERVVIYTIYRGSYDKLFTWTHKNGYAAVGSPYETYLTNTMSGDYAKMKAEIAIPVNKMPSKTD
jgi:effector-binding domain-containing protein